MVTEFSNSISRSFRRFLGSDVQAQNLSASENYSSSSELIQESSSATASSAKANQEASGESVQCPSCKGAGRIPKEMAETLVALIPVNDDRLKPKRTWAYVLSVVLICALLASTAIFILVPRAVDLSSTSPPVEVIHVFDHKEQYISFHFLNSVNISNANYYSIRVVNCSATIMIKFQPWSADIVGNGVNVTSVVIGPLSRKPYLLTFNNTVTLSDGVASYCQAPISSQTPLYVYMQFDIAATVEFLNHYEQSTISTMQQVCCVPSGNCTY
uniref:Transmembrane protein 106A n=1 Tax=Syphacia muris TaxID=451379 RepID=A0A0N5APM5_9BILA